MMCPSQPDFISALVSATRLVDRKMEFIQQHLDNNQNVEGEYLTYLLSNTQISIKDVYGSVSELLLAGVDTVNVHRNTFAFRFNPMYHHVYIACLLDPPPPHQTSNTLAWTLHLLSKYPQCQEILFKEVSTSVPADRAPTAEEVTRMPYLRAVVKESLRWSYSSAHTASKQPTNTQTYLHQWWKTELSCHCSVFLYIWCRMFPVVPMNGRILADKDVMIGGYQFSKNVSLIYSFLSCINFWIGRTIY